MKIQFILGRGLEGCGVTKFTIEFRNWLKKHNHEYRIAFSLDKKWSRMNAHSVDDFTGLFFSDKVQVEHLVNRCNEWADCVCVMSLPSLGVEDSVVNNFTWMLRRIKRPMTYFNTDHNIASIKRNEVVVETLDRVNFIFNQSDTNYFAEMIRSNDRWKCRRTSTGLVHKEMINFLTGVDFDAIRNVYWKEVDSQYDNHCKWIGRDTSWKGHDLMMTFHDQYLRAAGFISTLEGFTKAMGFQGIAERHEYHDLINKKVNIEDQRVDHPSYLYGRYIHAEMLERMSRTAFGFQLTALKPKLVGRFIEHTHCEVVASGAVPVFHASHGRSCTHRYLGKKLIDFPDSGTIWLDDSNMQESAKLLILLSKDRDLRDEYRENAYRFYKDHHDAEYTFKEIIDNIIERL